MPSHARNVKLYKDTRQLFTRYQVESQLDGLFTPTVTLPSGGYIVMNQTEALVSIDINSGKATREHNIEDTALKTNLEAAVEIARQLRLRDLAGLIVIDFIDMEENRNNRAVERKLKDALKNDRARIQVGRISHFGLLEMSRQRLRQGMMESSTRQCPHCEGTGVIRAVSSCALSVLRGIEEHLLSRKAESLDVRVHPDVAIYIFNEKRDALLSLEQNYGISIWIIPDRECAQAESRIERKPDRKGPAVRPVASATAVAMGDEMEAAEEEPVIEDEEDEEEVAASADAEARSDEDGEPRKKRRRRRGRRGGRRQREERQDGEASEGEELAAESDTDEEGEDTQAAASGEEAQDGEGNGEQRKKRRRRRGGRGRGAKSAEAGEEAEAAAEADAGEDAVAAEAEEPEAEPAEAVAEEAPAEEEKPAKKPRKRAAKKAAAADAAEAETVSADADEHAKPAKKPRKRAAKKAVEAEQQAEPETEKPAASNGGQRPEPEEPAKPELVAAEEPAAPRWQPPAPTVDPSTAPKKSGWWGKRS
jgi:ribonuclease E